MGLWNGCTTLPIANQRQEEEITIKKDFSGRAVILAPVCIHDVCSDVNSSTRNQVKQPDKNSLVLSVDAVSKQDIKEHDVKCRTMLTEEQDHRLMVLLILHSDRLVSDICQLCKTMTAMMNTVVDGSKPVHSRPYWATHNERQHM